MNCFDPLMDFPPPPGSDSIPDLLQVRRVSRKTFRIKSIWREIQTVLQNGQQQQQTPAPKPRDHPHFRSLTRAGHLPAPPPPRDILAVYAKRDPNSAEKNVAANSNPQNLPSSPLIVNMPATVRNRSEMPKV